MLRALVALFSLVLMLPSVLGDDAGPAKILLVGEPGSLGIVSLWLERDPMTDPRQVPARTHLVDLDGQDIQRFIRQYFPRTYEKLLEYEYIILLMMEVFHMTQQQQLMMYNAMYKDGLGGLQDRSVMSMADFIAHPWAESMVSDAFPNDADKVLGQRFAFENLPYRVVINTNPNMPPILKPYESFEGVEVATTPGTTCIAIPKKGATITSYAIGAFPAGYPGLYPDPGFKSPGWMPHTMYWRYGNATTWTHIDMLAFDLYWNPVSNPYSIDMILAEFMFATGRDLPEDVVLVHYLRGRFAIFNSVRSFIYSILEFIDKFGANATPLVSKIDTISAAAKEGSRQYLRQEYDKSQSTMDTAIIDMEALRSEAVRLKNRALFWVYVVEWLAVSGASLLAAFALWSLMIKRKLYREVVVTRTVAAD